MTRIERFVISVGALIAAAIGGLLTVVLSLGALYAAYLITGTSSQYVTWEAVAYAGTTYVLFRGAARTGKFASRMMQRVDGIFGSERRPTP